MFSSGPAWTETPDPGKANLILAAEERRVSEHRYKKPLCCNTLKPKEGAEQNSNTGSRKHASI
jgi:hypothetical protein